MKALKDFLYFDSYVHKFKLPFSILERIKYFIILEFFKKLPFLSNLYVNSRNDSFYLEIIGSFFYKRFAFIPEVFSLNFNGFLIGKFSKISFIKNGRSLNSFGYDFKNAEIAKSKSYGEFLERYFSSTLENNIYKKAKIYSCAELSSLVALPSKFHNYKHGNKSAIFKTLELESFFSKRKYPYPIHLIFWGEAAKKDSSFIYENTTSGCAGGFSKNEAIVGGLYELVERDSFLCYWLTVISPNIITITDEDADKIEGYRNLRDILSKCGYNLYVLDVTTNLGIPSICCVVRNNKTNGICVSGASHLSKIVAIQKAVSEIHMSLGIFNSKKNFILPHDYIFLDDERVGRNERMLLWKNGNLGKTADFLWQGKSIALREWLKTDIVNANFNHDNSINWQLNSLKDILIQLDNDYDEIYYFEFKDEILSKLGFYVVRIIAPKLLYLYMSEKSAIQESKRLEEFVLWKTGKIDYLVNIYPHPFP